MLGRGGAAAAGVAGLAAGGASGRGGGGAAGFGAGGTAGLGAGLGAGGAAGFGAAATGFAATGCFFAGVFGDAFTFTVLFAAFLAAFFAVRFATFFALRFLATTFRRFAGAARFAFLAFFPLAFFAFLAMIDLPIVRLSAIARRCTMRGATAIVVTFSVRHTIRPSTRSDRVASPQRSRHRASGRPVNQLDRMHHRDISARRDLHDAADVAGGDHIGSNLRDTRNLSVA